MLRSAVVPSARSAQRPVEIAPGAGSSSAPKVPSNTDCVTASTRCVLAENGAPSVTCWVHQSVDRSPLDSRPAPGPAPVAVERDHAFHAQSTIGSRRASSSSRHWSRSRSRGRRFAVHGEGPRPPLHPTAHRMSRQRLCPMMPAGSLASAPLPNSRCRRSERRGLDRPPLRHPQQIHAHPFAKTSAMCPPCSSTRRTVGFRWPPRSFPSSR